MLLWGDVDLQIVCFALFALDQGGDLVLLGLQRVDRGGLLGYLGRGKPLEAMPGCTTAISTCNLLCRSGVWRQKRVLCFESPWVGPRGRGMRDHRRCRTVRHGGLSVLDYGTAHGCLGAPVRDVALVGGRSHDCVVRSGICLGTAPL